MEWVISVADGRFGTDFACVCTMSLTPSSSIFQDVQPPAMGMPVLVVEDEPIARRALVSLLIHSGYRPFPAASAEEGLVLLSEGVHPAMALIDLDLPGMNGLEMIQWLHRLAPLVTSILVTATSRERINLLRQEQQNLLYIRKPIDFDRLLKMIQEHCPGRV